ncbi:unnamed protein product, partial [Brenthis ino]
MAILARLNTLEERFATPPPPQPSGLPLQVASTSLEHTPQPVQPALTGGATTDDVRDDDSTAGRASTLLLRESISTGSDTTGRIVEAITSLVKVSTKHSTINMSPLQLLVGSDISTPVIRALIRDVAIDMATSNREATMALRRQRMSSLLLTNQQKQDDYMNRGRRSPSEFNINDKVFVIKTSQAVGKLDSCMRGPYKVLKRLPHHRYELELLARLYGKRTEAAAENMVAWAGEWTPETCAEFFEWESDDSMHDTSAEAETSSSFEHSRVADEDDRPSGEAVLNEDE